MKVWLRILVSLFLIFVPLAMLQLLKGLLKITGELVLVGGSTVFIVGSLLLLSTLLLVAQLSKERGKLDVKFSDNLLPLLFDIYKKGYVSEEDVYKIKEIAKEPAKYGIKPAKFIYEASPKTIRYCMEYMTKPNHIAWLRKEVEAGRSGVSLVRTLFSHVLEHQQIKDERDKYLAMKYLR
jgi:hypothetical protein